MLSECSADAELESFYYFGVARRAVPLTASGGPRLVLQDYTTVIPATLVRHSGEQSGREPDGRIRRRPSRLSR